MQMIFTLHLSCQDTSELFHTDFEVSMEVKRIINVKIVK